MMEEITPLLIWDKEALGPNPCKAMLHLAVLTNYQLFHTCCQAIYLYRTILKIP